MRKKDFWLIIAAVTAAMILAVGQFTSEVITTGAWGLSFKSSGQAPLGPSSREKLTQYNAAYVGSSEEKVLYLTFDAGYENGCTEKILDTLQKHNVKAAFFLVGNYLEKIFYFCLKKTGSSNEAEDLFRQITGKELPKYYRPPQGIYSEENLKLAKELGYKTVFWSLAYKDWENDNQPTKDYALGKLIPRTHNGAVILLHSTSKTNAQVLEELLTQWKAAGYRFETIDKLFS